MKNQLVLLVVTGCLCCNTLVAQGLNPVAMIISKAIKAIDLKVQRLQNETLVLQLSQQAAEQELSKIKLSEITGWQEQLSRLYDGYFAELKQAKSVITGSLTVKKILSLQQQVVVEYGRLGKDAVLKPQYDGILNSSMEILQTLQTVLTSQLSMKDADRICVLQKLKEAMSHCLDDILSLNKQQMQETVNRARMQADLQFVKRLHGIQ